MADVIIKDMKYSPDPVTIKKGEQVCWTNKDSMKHTATADDESFDIQLPGNSGPKCQTFDEAGEFPYFCEIHPRMKGKVIVTE